MKKCKCCLNAISLLSGDYCDECYKRLPLHKKFVEGLKREHFFKQGSTNRSLGNFSEYQFKGNYNRCCNFPNCCYATTSLNNNIKSNSEFCSKRLKR